MKNWLVYTEQGRCEDEKGCFFDGQIILWTGTGEDEEEAIINFHADHAETGIVFAEYSIIGIPADAWPGKSFQGLDLT